MTLLVNKKVIILCAGKGTRFGEETQTVPKPLIEVKELNNKPILFSILSSLTNSDYRQIWIVKGYLAPKIEEFISTMQSETVFPQLQLHSIDSKQDYKLGPLHSLLSIRRDPDLFEKGSIYLVLPGDTIFESPFFQQISTFIDSHQNLLKQYPILFYRKVRGTKFKSNSFEKETHVDKRVSILHAKSSQPQFLKSIDQVYISQINEEIELKQLYPCFLLSYSILQRLLNVPELEKIPSIVELLNLYSELGKEIYITSFENPYNFYDIDYKSDFERLRE